MVEEVAKVAAMRLSNENGCEDRLPFQASM